MEGSMSMQKLLFSLALWIVTSLSLTPLTPAAHAIPLTVAPAATDGTSAAITIHATRKHRRHDHRYHSRRHRDHVVDAPFAYVESGPNTYVDAPFTEVYVDRRGRRVVAPFVDLWIPN